MKTTDKLSLVGRAIENRIELYRLTKRVGDYPTSLIREAVKLRQASDNNDIFVRYRAATRDLSKRAIVR